MVTPPTDSAVARAESDPARAVYYTEALKLLPDDGFGPDPTARDEITRALQYARGRVED